VTYRGKKGQAALEFIFGIPLLLTFFMALIEFSALLIHEHRVSALSREAANAAFRDCGSFWGGDLDDCLDAVVTQIDAGAGGMLPEFSERGRVIASVWRPDPASVIEPPTPVLASQRGSGNGVYSSKFSDEHMDSSLVKNHEVIAIGEVFYPYEPLTPLAFLIDLTGFPAVLHEATVY